MPATFGWGDQGDETIDGKIDVTNPIAGPAQDFGNHEIDRDLTGREPTASHRWQGSEQGVAGTGSSIFHWAAGLAPEMSGHCRVR